MDAPTEREMMGCGCAILTAGLVLGAFLLWLLSHLYVGILWQ